MPIIRNLRKDFDEGRMDNLRSLKYEDSGVKAPYVTKPEGSSSNEISKRVDDASRIAQMLIDKPGLKYLANEGLLRQGEIRRKTQAAADKKGNQKGGATAAGVFLAGVGGALEGTVAAAGQVLKIVGSTLAQVPVNGTGTHFVRGFNTDTYINGYYGFGSVNASSRALKGAQVIVNNDGSDGYNVLFPKENSDLADRQSTLTEKKSHDTQKWTDESTYTKTNTDENRANVVGGAHVNKSELLEKNTTASPGDLGTDIQAANDSGNLRSETKTINDYSSLASYTVTDTTDNVNNVTNGQSIPKPDNLLRNTTPSKGSLGVDKKDIEGTIPENVNVAQGNYRSDTTYTEKSTEDNIVNANIGVPINNPTGTGEFDQTFAVQTTSLEGTFGVTNKAIEGDIPQQDIGINKFKINTGKTKAKYSDYQNSNNALQGTPIPLKGDQRQTTAISGSIQGSASNREVTGGISELSPKTENTFTEASTYTGTSTVDNINAIQKQDNAAKASGIIGGRTAINAEKETVSKSSKEIGTSGSYNGVNYSLDSGKQIQDFRSDDADNKFRGEVTSSYSFNYNKTDINKETRVGLGNPGYKKPSNISYNDPTPELAIDKINALNVSTDPIDGTTADQGGNRDLIQLEFQVLTPDQTYYLAFRAFLDSFDDSFNGSWNTHKYLGRAENFYTYSGFERSINIGFKIAAQSQAEMEPLYRKAATLASVTAPTYGDNGRFMRGSIAKVTVGDYIYEQPGIIESVQYTWQKDYPWEIAFQGPELGDKTGPQVLPHVLDVSLSFKVIHDFLPQTGKFPFITNHKAKDTGNKKNYLELTGDV